MLGQNDMKIGSNKRQKLSVSLVSKVKGLLMMKVLIEKFTMVLKVSHTEVLMSAYHSKITLSRKLRSICYLQTFISKNMLKSSFIGSLEIWE